MKWWRIQEWELQRLLYNYQLSDLITKKKQLAPSSLALTNNLCHKIVVESARRVVDETGYARIDYWATIVAIFRPLSSEALVHFPIFFNQVFSPKIDR